VLFTSLDSAINDKNLFAYCDNNPISRADNGGEIWNIVIGAAAGGLLSAGISAYTQYKTTGEISLGRVAVAFGTGAISGGLAASCVGLIGQVAWNGVLGAIGSGLDNALDKKGDHSAWGHTKAIISGGTIGAVAGFIGGPGSGSTNKHMISMNKGLVKAVRSGRPVGKALKYWYSQTAKESIKVGKKALGPIVKSGIVGSSRSIYQSVKNGFR